MAAPRLAYYNATTYANPVRAVIVELDQTTIEILYPEVNVEYGYDGYNSQRITISGQFQSADSGRRYYLNGKQEKHTVYPGSLTIADANGNALTITPTGTNGYTVHTEGEPVRVNSKMNDTIREHTARCLNYNKPKPAELEA